MVKKRINAVVSTQQSLSTRMPTWSATKKPVPRISYVSPTTLSFPLCFSNRFSSLSDDCFEVLGETTQQEPRNKECIPLRSNSQPNDGHATMHFSACYDDDCYIHRSAKESCSYRSWFPRKLRHYNPKPVIDKTRQQMISAVSLYTTTTGGVGVDGDSVMGGGWSA